MTTPHKVSFIVTLYNKENYIHDTALSLINQYGEFKREFIFIDDNSTDNSITVLENTLAGVPDTRIIRNTANRGPSVRLNQAATVASGDFLFFFDSDDLLLPGAIEMMLGILDSAEADFIHGKHTTDRRAVISATPSYRVVDQPCTYALKSRPLTLTSCLVKSRVFRQAGGCDETVFIQDLSLNLRLACASRRMVDLDEPVMIRLEPEGNLTQAGGSAQAHHDGFFTFLNFARQQASSPRGYRLAGLASRRAISYGWKHARQTQNVFRRIGLGMAYLLSRAAIPALNHRLARPFESIFNGLQGIRKSTPLGTGPSSQTRLSVSSRN